MPGRKLTKSLYETMCLNDCGAVVQQMRRGRVKLFCSRRCRFQHNYHYRTWKRDRRNILDYSEEKLERLLQLWKERGVV